MRLPDDDELYEVDQTYLGPPGRYIGAFRHKAIFAWLAVGPLSFVVASKIGLEFNLMSIGLIMLATVWVSMELADRATNERPINAVFTAFWNDLKAPREERRDHHTTGETFNHVLRPRGGLGRYTKRRQGKD